MKRTLHSAFRKADAELLAAGKTIEPCKPRVNTDGMFPIVYIAGVIVGVIIGWAIIWAFSR